MKIAERFTHGAKPPPRPKPKVTCPRYESLPGERRCRHYLDGGACALPEEFMCVEWLKMHGHPVPPPLPLPPNDPAKKGSESARSPIPNAQLIRTLSDAEIESFRELGVEVQLATAKGELWLVPEYTGRERQELRFDHAATLAAVCAAFPGAQVMALDFDAVRGEGKP